jgi:hypothetical protein
MKDGDASFKLAAKLSSLEIISQRLEVPNPNIVTILLAIEQAKHNETNLEILAIITNFEREISRLKDKKIISNSEEARINLLLLNHRLSNVAKDLTNGTISIATAEQNITTINNSFRKLLLEISSELLKSCSERTNKFEETLREIENIITEAKQIVQSRVDDSKIHIQRILMQMLLSVGEEEDNSAKAIIQRLQLDCKGYIFYTNNRSFIMEVLKQVFEPIQNDRILMKRLGKPGITKMISYLRKDEITEVLEWIDSELGIEEDYLIKDQFEKILLTEH